MEVSVLIPEERIGALIGKSGQVKEKIERKTKTKITVSDCVIVSGEAIEVLKAAEIVKAIGRGFSPETAFLLFDDSYQFDVISLSGENQNTIKRLMSRVIGKKGATRKIIEDETCCFLSVFGKTVAVIGPVERIERAMLAVKDILNGKSHGYVYGKLKNKK